LIEEHFQQYSGFTMTRRIVNGMERVKANFTIEGWPIQIGACIRELVEA
jgi:hypothetical protein